jgi:hypothetical protein
MVALGLCGLIVAALGTATHLYWKYKTLTAGQIHSTHLVRGISEDLTETLRSVSVRDIITDPEPALLAAGQQMRLSNTETEQPLLEEIPVLSVSEPHSFLGSSKYFVVLTEHQGLRFEHFSSTRQSSGPRYIIWWINDGSTLELALYDRGTPQSTVRISPEGIPKGLVRSTFSASGVTTAKISDVDSQLVTADVQNLTFRYFDGTEWTSVWSMNDKLSIPLLVEVTLSLSKTVNSGNHGQWKLLIPIPQGAVR